MTDQARVKIRPRRGGLWQWKCTRCGSWSHLCFNTWAYTRQFGCMHLRAHAVADKINAARRTPKQSDYCLAGPSKGGNQ